MGRSTVSTKGDGPFVSGTKGDGPFVSVPLFISKHKCPLLIIANNFNYDYSIPISTDPWQVLLLTDEISISSLYCL